MRMFITSKNKYILIYMNIFWTCSIPLHIKIVQETDKIHNNTLVFGHIQMYLLLELCVAIVTQTYELLEYQKILVYSSNVGAEDGSFGPLPFMLIASSSRQRSLCYAFAWNRWEVWILCVRGEKSCCYTGNYFIFMLTSQTTFQLTCLVTLMWA